MKGAWAAGICSCNLACVKIWKGLFHIPALEATALTGKQPEVNIDVTQAFPLLACLLAAECLCYRSAPTAVFLATLSKSLLLNLIFLVLKSKIFSPPTPLFPRIYVTQI